MNLYFFDKNSKSYHNELIYNCTMCGEDINYRTIKSIMSYCDAGYLYLSDENKLLGFVCFSRKRDNYNDFGEKVEEVLEDSNSDTENNYNLVLDRNVGFKNLNIELICSNSGVGKFLIIKSLEYAVQNNFNRCFLEAKNVHTLPKYYYKFGFIKYKRYNNLRSIKCYLMELMDFSILSKYNLNDDIFKVSEYTPVEGEIDNSKNNTDIHIVRPKNLNLMNAINKKFK